MQPNVFIIIVNYNGLADTIECLESVQNITYPGLRTIVVDNGSSDHSVRTIRSRFPDIILLETGKNLGYAGGNNLGFEYALAQGADYMIVLNNDMVVAPGMVQALVDVATKDKGIGMVCGKVYYYSRRNVIWSAGSHMDLSTGTPNLIGNEEIDQGQHEHQIELQAIDGCLILVTRQVTEQTGLMDTTYFAYYEDTDWAFRVRQAGFKIIYTPDACAWHKVSASSTDNGKRSAFQVYYHMRNHLLFLSRYSRISFQKHVQMGLTVVFNVIKSCIRNDRSISRAKFCGILDFYRGRFGQRISFQIRRIAS